MFKRLIRKFFCWIFVRLYPKITILNNTDFNLVKSWDDSESKDKKYKLYPPYHVSKSQIGDYTYVSMNSNISRTVIGKFCSIGPNFFCGWGIHPTNGISTSPMFYSTLKQNGLTLTNETKIEERKPIFIGNDVFIGANVTVLDGVTIGNGAVIGAGAVVSKDIPPYAIAVGCPIKVIKYRMPEEQREAMLKINWWNFDLNKLLDVEKYFFDVDGFIEKMGYK